MEVLAVLIPIKLFIHGFPGFPFRERFANPQSSPGRVLFTLPFSGRPLIHPFR